MYGNERFKLAKHTDATAHRNKESGIPQKEIARLIGVSAQTVSKYMKADIFPALDTLAKLCTVLDVSADYILGTERN